LLLGVISQFTRDHPKVELTVRSGFSANFTDALENNEFDLAVNAVESIGKNSLLLRREKTFWVSSKNHQVHLQNPTPIALFDRSCWWRQSLLG
jgi:DNA-binding transcriptional LysR family regulator